MTALLPPSSETRPPLGLPRGSVRAALTLLIVAVVIVDLMRGRDAEPLWIEALMIALAHYFTSRRFINLSADVIRRLEAEGHIELEPRPLYLPRHSIRALIVLAFVGLAVYLFREDKLLQSQALVILGVIFAFVLGTMARGIRSWWTRGHPGKAMRGWADIKAAAVLLILAYTAAAHLFDRPDLAPTQMQNVTLGLVLFYFGSR